MINSVVLIIAVFVNFSFYFQNYKNTCEALSNIVTPPCANSIIIKIFYFFDLNSRLYFSTGIQDVFYFKLNKA